MARLGGPFKMYASVYFSQKVVHVAERVPAMVVLGMSGNNDEVIVKGAGKTKGRKSYVVAEQVNDGTERANDGNERSEGGNEERTTEMKSEATSIIATIRRFVASLLVLIPRRFASLHSSFPSFAN